MVRVSVWITGPRRNGLDEGIGNCEGSFGEVEVKYGSDLGTSVYSTDFLVEMSRDHNQWMLSCGMDIKIVLGINWKGPCLDPFVS